MRGLLLLLLAAGGALWALAGRKSKGSSSSSSSSSSQAELESIARTTLAVVQAYGPSSDQAKTAIENFQRAAGIPVSGAWDGQVREAVAILTGTAPEA